jgi:hypothetical protein
MGHMAHMGEKKNETTEDLHVYRRITLKSILTK